MSARIGLLEHFRKLAAFEGREDRASFWPYAALVLGIVAFAASVMVLPIMMRSMQAVQNIAAPRADDGVFDPEIGEFSIPAQAMPPESMPSAGFLAAYLGVTLGLAVLLYAAAVVRRLHDRGKSGAWGLMPLPFLAFTSVQLVRLFASTTGGQSPDMDLLFTLAVGNILYWTALLALVVLLAGASDLEPNRYDSTP